MTQNRETLLTQLLSQAFSPTLLNVINQSHLHAGHSGDNGSGESHFHLIIVSSHFTGLSRIARQQAVYKVVNSLFHQGLHALSMETKTPEENGSI